MFKTVMFTIMAFSALLMGFGIVDSWMHEKRRQAIELAAPCVQPERAPADTGNQKWDYRGKAK